MKDIFVEDAADVTLDIVTKARIYVVEHTAPVEQ
jgi:hypothetical protein